MNWSKNSWQKFPIKQQPLYSESEFLEITNIKEKIASYPGIVSQKSIIDLRKSLVKVNNKEAFILQGGDCAESFSGFNTQNLTRLFRLFLQMNAILMEGLQKPIVKIGRIAGQYAKPRSSDFEERNGITLPSYRGDIINGIEFTAEARKSNPSRIMETYFHAIATYNFIQQLARGGFASLDNISKWNEEFLEFSNDNAKFEEIITRINTHIKFFMNCGYSAGSEQRINQADFFTSHEALLLHYEEAFVREYNGKNYCLSADQLWIGDRTRNIDSAHIEFLRGIENPIGIKVGPTANANEIAEIIKILNPRNELGKIILITRIGAKQINDLFPDILEKITSSEQNVIWQTDPMHGNMIKLDNGYKTRNIVDISTEISTFFKIHEQFGTYAGGIHLEMTGNNVTECIGGMQNILSNNIPEKYETYCDPRLNSSQSLQVMLEMVSLNKV